MILNIVYLIIGLALILGGANILTDGASALAKRWGMSDLIVGLTVVAFGTSTPELVISVTSAIEGNAGLAVGNVVGSNIFNICVIIGITALIKPIKVDRNIITTDIPLVILSALVLLAIGNSSLLDGTGINVVTRVDGIILLLFFCIFLRHTFASAKGIERETQQPQNANTTATISYFKAIVYIIGGLAGLVFGGDRFVAGASGIASSLGVSDEVIGLTIVAAGTSLPELAASIAAAIKGHPGIAIGNVIGSNIFNIFLILGCAAVIRPLPFGDIGNFDLLTLTGSCAVFWVFGWLIGHRTITRFEGGILTAIYIGYITVLLLRL